MLFFLVSLIYSSVDYKSKYTETPSDVIKYDPKIDNEYVGIKGTRIEHDGLVLRRSLAQGGIVHFVHDNEYDEWAFSYTITDINLHFPEEGGVYLWYTADDQNMGNFRGGNGEFVGLMAGIEFKGLSPELIFTFNDGTSYANEDSEVLYRDALNPLRLKGVKELTVKVIVTKNNFKIELYEGDRLLYDSLKMVSSKPYASLGTDKRFSITSYYNNTSSEKSFKLIKAQLYKRVEHADYDPDKVHNENVSKLPKYEHEVNHPDREMRHFIAQFTHYMEYMKSVLGDTDNPMIYYWSNKILEKLDKIKDEEKKPTIADNNIQYILDKINDMDLRIQNISKATTEMNHTIKDLEKISSTKSDAMPYIFLVLGVSLFIMISLREIRGFTSHPKKL